MRRYLACYYRYATQRKSSLCVVPDPGQYRYDRYDGLPCTAYDPIVTVAAPNIREARRAARYIIEASEHA